MNTQNNIKQLDYRTVDNNFMLEQTSEKKERLKQQIKKIKIIFLKVLLISIIENVLIVEHLLIYSRWRPMK